MAGKDSVGFRDHVGLCPSPLEISRDELGPLFPAGGGSDIARRSLLIPTEDFPYQPLHVMNGRVQASGDLSQPETL